MDGLSPHLVNLHRLRWGKRLPDLRLTLKRLALPLLRQVNLVN